MEELPDSLKNRFFIYLNILPPLASFLQYILFISGIILVLIPIIREALKLSRSLQPSHRVSNPRKFSSIYPDMIQRLGDMEKVFELKEKSRKKSISRADLLSDADSSSEKKFMLEDEPAISEDEGSESDTRSDCDRTLVKVSITLDTFSHN